MKPGHRRSRAVDTDSNKYSTYAAGASAARRSLASSVSVATRRLFTFADDTLNDGATEARVAGTDGGGASRYAEGPCTRMYLAAAVNAGLRTAMETDATAVRSTRIRMRLYPQCHSIGQWMLYYAASANRPCNNLKIYKAEKFQKKCGSCASR